MNKKATLLLIDDDPAVLQTFRFWLEDEGYTVFTAQSKSDALTVLQTKGIDVCLIDLKMKEENGIHISAELKEIDSLLKVIIITGYPTYETAIDAIKMGIFDYVSKASENKDILQKIQNAVHARQEEIDAKSSREGTQEKLVLVCHHMMIKEGFENFCRENPQYALAHTYHSMGYIKNRDFNHTASLVLVCSNCNQNHIENPLRMMSLLTTHFPNARPLMINCQLKDEKKIRLLQMGFKGFLPKDIFKENMKKAFQTILSGQMWISRNLSQTLLMELLDTKPENRFKKPTNSYNLSNRELEILEAVVSGLSNNEISKTYSISEKTVKAHINHIFKKMSVTSRTKAIRKATEENIV